MGRTMRLTARWSCSMRLLRYFDWRISMSAPESARMPWIAAVLAPLLSMVIRHAVQVDGAREEATRGGVVAVCAQQEVDRLAGLVDRAVQILPFARALDVGLVHTPAQPDGALAPTSH